MSEKKIKTNVIRILDKQKISYDVLSYTPKVHNVYDGQIHFKDEDPNTIFKTIVVETQAKIKTYYVFVIPVLCEIDLKKAAVIVGEKSLELLKQTELQKLTGYIRDGCSPIGMKKSFKTVFSDKALEYEKIIFSAGQVGVSVKLRVSDIKKYYPNFSFCDVL